MSRPNGLALTKKIIIKNTNMHSFILPLHYLFILDSLLSNNTNYHCSRILFCSVFISMTFHNKGRGINVGINDVKAVMIMANTIMWF